MQPRIGDSGTFPLRNLLTVITLAILLMAVWYLFAHYLRSGGKDIAWYPPETPCNLHRGACHAPLGEQARLHLALGSEIAPLEPLPIEVRLEGAEAERVVVLFEGRGMDMGLHRFVLDAVSADRFRGLGQFGVCSLKVMPWRIKVLVDTADGRKGSWFDIEVRRRSG
ncbi:hypothetical protein SAMN02745148_02240 [Modicisalibacter ilicicola DSM 19980]|uniref:Uncharacterized protein n=1 Tax=Modicisalibacter ilicicola DSM 19980 TaxID=1121942 RepID=A0A1M5AF92_9GAMM|nr:hypothetical protein [Halomonas ilicicola]SHF28919.1 hypothetical protein SAMN02745148_02240 [Halomonas ilicicola DSM 19980]